MNRKYIPTKNDLENENLISSSSYFEDSSADEDYLLRNIIPNKKKIPYDYFDTNSDSENEYKTRKPDKIYKTEDKHFGRVNIILNKYIV